MIKVAIVSTEENANRLAFQLTDYFKKSCEVKPGEEKLNSKEWGKFTVHIDYDVTSLRMQVLEIRGFVKGFLSCLKDEGASLVYF